MKQTIFTLCILFFLQNALAQRFEIGPTLGGTNYIGDVGKTNYFGHNKLGYGVVGKWNKSLRHSLRASFLYLPILADDAKSSEPFRENRGLSFTNSIKELSVGVEYTFWDWSFHTFNPGGVPYLYTGITGVNYGSLALDNNSRLRAFADTWTMAIPMVLGYKFQISRFLRASFEISARYTFTDNIDGSDPNQELKDREDLKFGNLNSNDWYTYTGFTLTYTFGRIPCACPY